MMNPELSIQELLKIVKHSFRECEFNEVQNILQDREKKMKIEIEDLKTDGDSMMYREKEMKIEIEDLKRDLDSMKKEACLLERSQGLVELEKLRLEEKLQRSQRKSEELNEKITRLTEEHKVSSDRAKRAQDHHEKVSQENSKMICEKNKFILELNGKINELKNKNLENEQLVGVYKEKFRCLDANVVEMAQEIADLRHEKLVSNQTMVELRRKQFEADKVVVELKRQNFEANRTLDGLEHEKMESNSKLENLAPRVKKMEMELANMFNVKVEKLAKLADFMDKFAAAAKGKDSLENDGTNANAENVFFMSPGVQCTSYSTGSEAIPLVMKGSQSHDSVARTHGEAQPSGKMAFTSPAARDVIEICDSDDETMPDYATYISDTSSGPTTKRNKTELKREFSPESDYKEEKKHFQKRRG